MGESNVERCRNLLRSLADDPHGWNGDAGEAFVRFMGNVLERKAASIASAASGLSATDAAAEVVLIVSGSQRDALCENARRISDLSNPLGYLVSAVSSNLDRAKLSDALGVGSRELAQGAPVATPFSGFGEQGRGVLDSAGVRTPWALPASATSREAVSAARMFEQVLVGRFHARARVVRGALELAADRALERDRGAGATPRTVRARAERFAATAGELRQLGMRRDQISAMSGLLFGSVRHPEWSLYAACAHAVVDGTELRVSSWQAERARIVASRQATTPRVVGPAVQPALFPAAESTAARMVVRGA